MRLIWRLWHVIDSVWFELRTGIVADCHEYETLGYEIRGEREYQLLRCRCGVRTELWRWMS